MSFIEFLDCFDDVFSDLNDPWELKLMELVKIKKWLIKQHHGPIDFHCDKCERRWDSGHASVLFLYKLLNKFNRKNKPIGVVKMKILGQKCRWSALYHPAEFSPDEVLRAIKSLRTKVVEKFYKDPGPRESKEKENQEEWKATLPHVTGLCEACQLGFCQAQPFTVQKHRRATKQQGKAVTLSTRNDYFGKEWWFDPCINQQFMWFVPYGASPPTSKPKRRRKKPPQSNHSTEPVEPAPEKEEQVKNRRRRRNRRFRKTAEEQNDKLNNAGNFEN
ncbi:unnamed protein product [Didymodactylos carnosus]|uniref:3CxxC-type domain-containing protein n=1 Tax=Didymodactylos carnosus TaxID=1234261 RepID=A0A814D9S7_9BILA|nr:unnamed protein product [Didymodactylos carnosus]CAF3730481.1 unnamed protein product [Didymodactylos carnosus]